VVVTPSFPVKPEMASFPVFPARGKLEMASWCNTKLGWKPGGGVISRQIVLPILATVIIWREVL
jgi:hypothetical protein